MRVQHAQRGAVEDKGPGNENQGPFEPDGEVLDFAVAVGMVLVLGQAGQVQAVERKPAGKHVDDAFQGIGEHRLRAGEVVGVKLDGHQPGAHHEGEQAEAAFGLIRRHAKEGFGAKVGLGRQEW